MSSIAPTSAGVNRWGDVCGQDDLIVKRTRMLQPTPGLPFRSFVRRRCHFNMFLSMPPNLQPFPLSPWPYWTLI